MSFVYSHLKVLHYPDKIASLPRDNEAILPPLHIRIKPTNVCNHRCRYCAYRLPDLDVGKDMSPGDSIPLDKMLELIDDAAEMGVGALTFSGGGEPFLYKHFAPALRRLVKSPVKFASLTNGSLLAGEPAELFAARGSWIRVSMDGYDAASYAAYRNVGLEEFAKVLDNIERFKKLGGECVLGVSFIVDKDNYAHILDMVRRVRDAGADNIKISPCITSVSGKENNRIHAVFHDEAKRLIAEAKACYEAGGFEVFDAYHQLAERFEHAYSWCPNMQILPVVGADMNVYTCQDKAYDLSSGLLGSIRDRRFKDFWCDGKEKFFRVNPSRDCGHHCVAARKNELIMEYLGIDTGHLAFV